MSRLWSIAMLGNETGIRVDNNLLRPRSIPPNAAAPGREPARP
jgi:hypothetical protein